MLQMYAGVATSKNDAMRRHKLQMTVEELHCTSMQCVTCSNVQRISGSCAGKSNQIVFAEVARNYRNRTSLGKRCRCWESNTAWLHQCHPAHAEVHSNIAQSIHAVSARPAPPVPVPNTAAVLQTNRPPAAGQLGSCVRMQWNAWASVLLWTLPFASSRSLKNLEQIPTSAAYKQTLPIGRRSWRPFRSQPGCACGGDFAVPQSRLMRRLHR